MRACSERTADLNGAFADVTGGLDAVRGADAPSWACSPTFMSGDRVFVVDAAGHAHSSTFPAAVLSTAYLNSGPDQDNVLIVLCGDGGVWAWARGRRES